MERVHPGRGPVSLGKRGISGFFYSTGHPRQIEDRPAPGPNVSTCLRRGVSPNWALWPGSGKLLHLQTKRANAECLPFGVDGVRSMMDPTVWSPFGTGDEICLWNLNPGEAFFPPMLPFLRLELAILLPGKMVYEKGYGFYM